MRRQRQTISTLILIALLWAVPVYADNTASADLEVSSAQSFSITDDSQTGLDFSTTMTLMAWVRPESFTEIGTIVAKGGPSNQISYWFFVRDNDFQLITSSNGSTEAQAEAAYDFSTNTWYHVAVTYNAGTLVFYVNGDVVPHTGLAASSLFNSSQPFVIGDVPSSSGARGFDGLIDDVKVFNAVLSEATIESYMSDCSFSAAATNLQGWWAFENSALDETANNNDLTNNNSATYSATVPYSCAAAGGTVERQDIFIF